MTTIDNITEAINQCDEVKARLMALRDMVKPKPVLRIESVIHSNHVWELHCADDLVCPEGTVIEASDGWRHYRLSPDRAVDWKSNTGQTYSHEGLWNNLTSDAADGITFKYSGSF